MRNRRGAGDGQTGHHRQDGGEGNRGHEPGQQVTANGGSQVDRGHVAATDQLASGSEKLRLLVQQRGSAETQNNQHKVEITHKQRRVKGRLFRFLHAGYREQAHQDMGQSQRPEQHGDEYSRHLYRVRKKHTGREDRRAAWMIVRGRRQQGIEAETGLCQYQ